MSTEQRLKISSPQVDSGATGTLKIEVALVEPSGTTEDARDPIQIELVLDRAVIPADLVRAAERAADQAGSRSDVSQWVTLEGAGNWKPWARPFGDDPKSFTLWISNDRNENQKPVDQAQRGTVPLSIEIPLRDDLEEKKRFPEVRYRYATAYRSERRRIFDFGAASNLELWVLAKNEAPPAKRPAVRLFTPAEAPHARKLGDTLDLEWEVRDGVSGKLTGPFAGATRVIQLAVDGEPSLAKGKIKVMALGTQIYELEATVALDEDKDTVVRRRLIVDVVTDDDYAALKLVPSVVLPRGRIEASWFVSGVHDAKLNTGDHSFTVLERHAEPVDAQGILPFPARSKGKTVTVWLTGSREDGRTYEVSDTYTVRRWSDISDVDLHEPTPGRRDLAYAQRDGHGFLALRVDKRLRYKEVGVDDRIGEIDWKTLEQVPWETVACTGFPGGFAAVLWFGYGTSAQRAGGDYRLATFFPGHVRQLSATSPGFLNTCLLAGLRVQVCVLEGRGYVIVRTKRSGFAWSFPIVEPLAGYPEATRAMPGEWREEPLLTAMAAYALCVCDGALYALDRETGQLYRLAPGEDPRGGTLMAPRICAPAVDEKTKASLVKTGACVAIDRLLAVVGSDNEQDVVYKPEWNVWGRCGRDQENALAVAYRPGGSLRLWALHRDPGSKHQLSLKTLSVDSISLFDCYHQDGTDQDGTDNPNNTSTSPKETWLDEKSSFSIINSTGETLELPDVELLAAGYAAMELDEGVGVLAPQPLAPGDNKTLEFHHAKGNGPRGDLRYVMSDSGLVVHIRFQPTATDDGNFELETSISYLTKKPGGAIDGLVPLPALRTTSTGTSLELKGVVGYFAVVMRNDTRYRLVLEPTVHEPEGKTAPPGESMRMVLAVLAGTPDETPEHRFQIHLEDAQGARRGTYRLSPSYSKNLVYVDQERLDDPMARCRSSQVVPATDPRAAELGLKGRPGQILELGGLTPELQPECHLECGPNGAYNHWWRYNFYLGWHARNCNRVQVELKLRASVPKITRDDGTVFKHSWDKEVIEHTWMETKGTKTNDRMPYLTLQTSDSFHGLGEVTVALTPELVWQNETYRGATRELRFDRGESRVLQPPQLDGKPFHNDAAMYYPPAMSDRPPNLGLDVKVNRPTFSDRHYEISLGWDEESDCERVLLELEAEHVTEAWLDDGRYREGRHDADNMNLPLDHARRRISWTREFNASRASRTMPKLVLGSQRDDPEVTLRVTPLRAGFRGITRRIAITTTRHGERSIGVTVVPAAKPSCVGHWPFDEVDGTTAADRSGHDENAVLHGPTEPVGPTPRSRRRGRRFDGRTAYAQIPNDERFDFGKDDDFSVAVWVRPEAGSGSVVEKWSASGPYPFVIRSNEGVITVARYDGSQNPAITSSRSLLDGDFHHVAFIKRGKQLSLYVDGELDRQTEDTIKGETGNDSDLFVGRRGKADNEFFAGAVSDLRIYDHALLPEAVRALHGLVGHWTFPPVRLAKAILPVVDLSGNGLVASGFGEGVPLGPLFDGKTHLQVLPDRLLDFGTDEDFSVALWISPDPKLETADVLEKWSGSGGYPFVIRYDAGKVIVGRYDSHQNPTLRSRASIREGGPHHVAFVKRGKTLSLYIDGNLDGQTPDTTSGETRNDSALFIGMRGGATSSLFEGEISELRIYGRALSGVEVCELASFEHKPHSTATDLCLMLGDWGRTLVALGRLDEALPVLERALEEARGEDVAVQAKVDAHFDLARLLMARSEQHNRARQLGEEALRLLRGLGDMASEQARQVYEWTVSKSW